MPPKKIVKKKKVEKSVSQGRVYVTATFNNTIVTVTDDMGQPVLIGSAGGNGFTGTRKSTPYAATITVQKTLQKAIDEMGLREVGIYLKGVGPGREASLKAIKAMEIEINTIMDMTPIPHNGVRPPKAKKG